MSPERPWSTAQLVAVFVLVLVAGVVGLRVLLRLRRAHVPRRHVVVPSWTPIVEALLARGVEAPELLVGALANWDLRLAQPVAVGARLPCAVATVAQALGRTLPDVQRAVVARTASPERAAAFLEELRALRARLDDLPGVAGVGALWPDDAGTLARAMREYARLSGID